MNVFKRKLFYVCLVLSYYSVWKICSRHQSDSSRRVLDKWSILSKPQRPIVIAAGQPPRMSNSGFGDDVKQHFLRPNLLSVILMIILGVFAATVFLTLTTLLSLSIVFAICHSVMMVLKCFFGRRGEDPPDVNPDPLIGDTINNYRIVSNIGTGRFGTVYLGRSSTRKAVAIKSVTKGTAPDFIILREWMALCLAKNLPFVIQFVERFDSAANHFFVTEYASRMTLLTLLENAGALEAVEVRFYTSEIVTALGYLHKEGILVRDLRLENVMLNSDGHVKIVDFGSSAIGVFGRHRRLSKFKGTLVCIAPEVLLHQPYGHAIDMWALGIVIYELFEECHPFLREEEIQTMRSILRSAVHFADTDRVNPDAADLTMRLLDKNQDTRITLAGVKGHAFYSGVNWSMVEGRQLQPPTLPRKIRKQLCQPTV